jgi:hypothetical protein
MIYLNLDENNYLLSVSTVGKENGAEVDLSAFDLSGQRIRAHKWENDTLIFDEKRWSELVAEHEAEAAAIMAETEQQTELEQLRADVDYLAEMTGIEL